MSSFLAGLAGGLLGYSRGQVSVGSFTALVGVSLLAYAYLGGITSVTGALIAGPLAPLGIGYVLLNDVLGEQPRPLLPADLGAAARRDVDPQPGRHRRSARARRQRVCDRVGAPAIARARRARLVSAALARSRMCSAVAALRSSELTVGYGGLLANDDVSLEVRAGTGRRPDRPERRRQVDLRRRRLRASSPYRGEVALGGAPLDGLPPHRRRASASPARGSRWSCSPTSTVRANVAGRRRSRRRPRSFLARPRRPGRARRRARVDRAPRRRSDSPTSPTRSRRAVARPAQAARRGPRPRRRRPSCSCSTSRPPGSTRPSASSSATQLRAARRRRPRRAADRARRRSRAATCDWVVVLDFGVVHRRRAAGRGPRTTQRVAAAYLGDRYDPRRSAS